MGWFKSAEEKAAEKRRNDLVEKYGEKDGLLIFENKISEKKYLEKIKEEEKEEEKKTDNKILKFLDDIGGRISLENNLLNNPTDDDIDDEVYKWKERKTPLQNKKDFVKKVISLFNNKKIFSYDTWEGSELPSWIQFSGIDISKIENLDDDYINEFCPSSLSTQIFTKKCAEECIKKDKRMRSNIKKEKTQLKEKIKTLLTKKSIKMTISDITAHIKHDNRNYVKSFLEEMHKDEDIDFAGSGRYFIYSEEKKSSKKASTKKADPTAEIRKYAKLRDDGLITEEEYQAKKKEILGL